MKSLAARQKQLWDKYSGSKRRLEYILPQRTSEQFELEGITEAERIQKLFNPDSTIAEFGCGVGRILKHLKAKKKYGIDISIKFLSQIKEIDIIKVHTDGSIIFLNNNSIDFIYSIMVFQHIPLPLHIPILKELSRILKPGGSLFIQLPQKGKGYYKETKFVNTFSPDIFPDYCRAGFKEYTFTEGNLAGYGKGGEFKPEVNLEYFIKFIK